MSIFLQLFIIIPLVSFLVNLLIPARNEKWLSRGAFYSIGALLSLFLVFVVYWLFRGHPTLNVKDLVIFKSLEYEFFIDFYFDDVSAVYFAVGGFLTFLVTVYSRVYLHREPGYKRFFNTIQFFYLGYNIIVLSGNLETLFLGWEILGISSYLLVAFYRERFLPVRNAMKVYSIYRLGDIGLILAMWLIHHLFHANLTFAQLHDTRLIDGHVNTHNWIGLVISLMILLAAAAKSAQLPFSSWLPRAMEGPTPSSAIFYGSLSVHLGVFLLLRTYPFWEHQASVRILIAALGLATSLIATFIARVQSSAKSQIAYASIAQIGLIFIEVACGFEMLALFHFAGNAFLRTYQLLVSPSVVTYLIREQFYNFVPRPSTPEDTFPKRLQYSLWILSMKEWNLDIFIHRIYWQPLKKAGKLFRFINFKVLLFAVLPLFLGGVAMLLSGFEPGGTIHQVLPPVMACLGLILVIRAFTERRDAILSWILIVANHFWIALAVSFNEHFDFNEVLFYLSGVVVSGILGVVVLRMLSNREKKVNLTRFQGHAYEHPRLALFFLIACLGLSGFPITTTFIGEDLIFSHLHEHQVILVIFVALSMITDGLAVMRIYSKIFLGPHTKTYHTTAFKSS